MNPELCRLLANGGVVSCFLSDSSGTPIGQSGITCTPINGREDVEVTLPNGQEVTLQKVSIKKTGSVVADAVIEISGEACNPREQFSIDRCITKQFAPPQCGLSLNQTRTDLPKLHYPNKGTEGIHPNQLENLCVNTEKVYDWITQQSNIQLRKNANDAPFICNICTLNFFVPAVTICKRTLTGTLECNGERVEGALINFSSTPGIVSFSPDPAVTDANGHFTTVVTVPEGTNPTPIEITASTTTSGEFLSTTLPTIARCLAEPCILFLFGPETIDCNDIVSGRVRCGNTFIPGVEVTLTANPAVVTFNHNPAITGENGNYFSDVIVPDGTPPTDVEITASATVEGELLTETITVNVACETDCELTLTSDALITCEGEITGILTCEGAPVEGAMIEFSIFPSVGTFNPNPATTMADGSFSTTLTIPEGTPLLATAITANTMANGETITTSVGLDVECPTVDECPCKFRIGVAGGSAPASVDIMTGGMAATLTGTINVTAVQCFTAAPMCNPASDNFNISFGGDGNTINFLAGRRIEIECEGNTFARVRGTARATGNVLPSGIYEVTITRGISGGLAVWTVNATDFHGNTFSTTFTANINPVTFIGDCTDIP